jgi:hypothetical protein
VDVGRGQIEGLRRCLAGREEREQDRRRKDGSPQNSTRGASRAAASSTSKYSRQVYNDAVLTYDNALETVPTNIVAGVFTFEPREYFEVEEAAAREAPRVAF